MVLTPGLSQVASAMWGKLTGAQSPHATELSAEEQALYDHHFQRQERVVGEFLQRLATTQVS
jgi:hypothetical protein